MRKNELYAFAKLFLNHPEASLKFVFKQDFIVHELSPVATPLTLQLNKKPQCLKVDSHHLSFYKEFDPENPNLSVYHYTAYLTHKNDEYQLHVYFNGKDEIVGKTKLSIKKADGTCELITLNEDSIYAFEDLAVEQSAPPIRKFRKLYKIQAQSDIQKYEAQIAKTEQLSRDLTKNLDAYLTELKNTISVLKELLKYQRNYHYFSMLRLFLADYSTLKRQQRIGVSACSVVEVEDSSEEDNEIIVEFKVTKKTKSMPEVPIVARIAEANEAFKAFQVLIPDDKASRQACVDALNNAHQLAMQTELFITKTNCTPKEREQLRFLIQSSQQNKQKLLEQLLVNGEFAEAQRSIGANAEEEGLLTSFSLAEYIQSALQTRNVKLLEFLLSNHDVRFLINDLSLAAFCLNQASAKEPILKSLISLIKHGLSLFEIDPESKLPIAHVILSTPNHPLYQAFIETQELTILNKRFFRTLINQLQEIKLCVSEYQAEILAKAIVSYSNTAKRLVLASRTETKQLEKQINLNEKISQHFTPRECSVLRSDPKIQEKMAVYRKAEQVYLNCLSRIEKLKLNKRTTDMLSQVDALLTNREAISEEDLREAVVNYLDNQIKLCHVLKDLSETQKKITSTQWIAGRRNKQLEKLQKEEARLLQQYNELSPLKIIEADQKKAGLLAGPTMMREQSKCNDKIDDAYKPINSVRAELSIFKPPISELPVRAITAEFALQKADGDGDGDESMAPLMYGPSAGCKK